jgi:hypothetical protein
MNELVNIDAARVFLDEFLQLAESANTRQCLFEENYWNDAQWSWFNRQLQSRMLSVDRVIEKIDPTLGHVEPDRGMHSITRHKSR